MSAESVTVDWLNPKRIKSVIARRFAEFCAKDFVAQHEAAEMTAAEANLYKDAAQLMVERIEAMASGSRK